MSDRNSPRDGAGHVIPLAEEPDGAARPPGVLTAQMADGLRDMLTVVLVSLEQLAGEPLTERAGHQVARADKAAHCAGVLLWQALDAGAGLDGLGLPHPRPLREGRP